MTTKKDLPSQATKITPEKNTNEMEISNLSD